MNHSHERSPQQARRGPDSSITECMIVPEGDGTFRLSLGCGRQGAVSRGFLTLPYTASFAPLSLSDPETGTAVTVTAEEMRTFMAYGYDFATESGRFASLYPEGAPRVAFLVNDPSPMGGGTITLCRYINWLADLGVEVGLYTEGPLPDWTTVNARFHRIPDFNDRYAAVTEPVVVIFSIFEVPFFLGCNDTRGKRVYHLCQGAEEFHFTNDSSDPMRPVPVFDLLNTLPVGRLVVSPHLERYFARKYGQATQLIANGIDPDLFRPGPSRRPDHRFTVLVCGKPLHELKGVAVVREALTLLSTRRPDHEFRLVNVCGSPPETPLLPGAGFEYELLCGVPEERMRDRYLEADVYVNASRYEGFGLPTLEAMACGTPVIQADNHGMEGVVEDGRDCLVFPPGDPAALAQALERLLDDAPLRERLARNGRDTADGFTLANQHRMLREVFGAATGRPLGRDGAEVSGATQAPLFQTTQQVLNQQTGQPAGKPAPGTAQGKGAKMTAEELVTHLCTLARELTPPELEKFYGALAPIVAHMAKSGAGTDACLQQGCVPLPVHFYSPVPDIADLKRRGVYATKSNLAGIRWDPAAQAELLLQLGRRFGQECDFPPHQTNDPHAFYTENNCFSFGCAAALHCVLRFARPSRVIEVGSGFSSKVINSALALNRGGSCGECDYSIVDPYPDAEKLERLNGLTRLMRQPVETLAASFFDDLSEGDVLFIDSGHVVKTGGDVNFLILDVLPRLQSGVFVHFHDIPMPWEYGEVYHTNPSFRVFWTESYLLQAFLACNDSFEVLFSMPAATQAQPELLSRSFAHYDPSLHRLDSGSIWIRRK